MQRHEIISLLEAALKAKSMTPRSASLAIGRNHAFLHQFIYAGTPKKLAEDDRQKLAKLLGLREENLKEDIDIAMRQSIEIKSQYDLQSRVENDTSGADHHILYYLKGMIPVLDYSKISSGVLMINSNKHIAYIPRVPAQKEDMDAYAVKAPEDNPACRIRAGDTLYVLPNGTKIKGQPCLLMMGKRGIITKEYTGEDDIDFVTADFVHPIVGLMWI